jgi:hypothetical protein
MMASNYDKIGEDIKHDGDLLTNLLELLGEKLYPEKTHFIFELLQNAEDAGAARIQFNLYDDRLEVLHNGEAFNKDNVKGICSIGEGTKKDDFTKIGKIGIGFKSVYTFTDSPEIHSGEEHFKIENYVRPSSMPPKPFDSQFTTLFIVPFNRGKIMNRSKIDEETSREKIAAGLKNLKLRTILFLRKIKQLEYKLTDNTHCEYKLKYKTIEDCRYVTLTQKINQETPKEENWLIYERPVELSSEDGKIYNVYVEIAFLRKYIEENGKTVSRLVTADESVLNVFFPTEKETHLGFLIQGPYITTPSRDNILRDNKWNEGLIEKTADLMADILPQLKEAGLLTASFLGSMPIKEEHFAESNIFRPISRAVLKELQTKELLPASDGSFVSAKNAKFARGSELRRLLDYGKLNMLYNTANLKWVSQDFSQQTEDPLYQYLTKEQFLNIEVVQPLGFCRKAIETKFFDAQKHDITWLQNFYIFLADQKALWQEPGSSSGTGYLRDKPFVLLENDVFSAPFPDSRSKTPKIYLPSAGGSDYPAIKADLLKDAPKVMDFFSKQLDIKKPDICDDVVTGILPKYNGTFIPADSEHEGDIQKIFQALQSDSESQKRRVLECARNTPFLKVKCDGAATEYLFKRPADTIYFDIPELHEYFDGIDNVYFLAELIVPTFDYTVFKVHKLPKITQITCPVNDWGRKVGNDNYRLDKLDEFLTRLKSINDFETQKKKALVLWRFLSEHRSISGTNFLHGTRYWFQRTQYGESIDSDIKTALLKETWIPVKENTLSKPYDTSISHLCDELLDDKQLIKELNIPEKDKTQIEKALEEAEKERKEELAKELGVEPDDIEVINANPEAFKEWKSKIKKKKAVVEFPDKVSSNPKLRNKRVKEIAAEEKERTNTVVERTVSITEDEKPRARAYLLHNYKDDDEIMHCQICGMEAAESPFRTTDQFWHFQAEPFLPSLRNHLHAENFLALCHNHAAMYRFIDDKELSTIEDKIRNRARDEGRSIQVKILDKEREIWFTQDHLNDLKSLLEQSKKNGEPKQ